MGETKKLTKKEKFGMLLNIKEVAENEMLVEFINKELELLNKKNGKNGQTKGQKENEGYKDTIVEILTRVGKGLTISEIQAEDETLAQFSNQKISALLTQLVNDKIVTRTKDKKITTFAIAE